MELYENLMLAHRGWAALGKRILDIQLPCMLGILVSVGLGHERAAEPDKVLSISTSGAGRLFATKGKLDSTTGVSNTTRDKRLGQEMASQELSPVRECGV